MALAEISGSVGRGADDVQVQHDHRVRREAALRFLLHILGHFGVGETEARVPGEFGLGHRGELAGVVARAAHVVHAADRHAAGVGERGDNHDAVGRFAADGGDGGCDDVRLEREVAAEGGVAAADEAQAQAAGSGGLLRPRGRSGRLPRCGRPRRPGPGCGCWSAHRPRAGAGR